MLSSVVPTVTVALPDVGMLTVREPVLAPKSPTWPTVTLTVSSALGAGLAVTVNWASPPSVTSLPAMTLISGCVGGGSSSSDTATVATPASHDFT